MTNQLYGLSPTSPATFAGASVLLLTVTLVGVRGARLARGEGRPGDGLAQE